MSAVAPDCVTAIDIVHCALPLSQPVHIGRTVYHERGYVALRLVTATGLEGHAIGYTRGLPLLAMVRMLSDGILGRHASHRQAILADLVTMNVNAAGSLWRAFSLVDIALADAEARHAGVPYWKLLGGARERVPLMVVAGYHAGERDAGSVTAEVHALVDAGFRHIKLHTIDVHIVAAVRASLADDIRIGGDAGMRWRSLSEALEACRDLDDLGLAFIEDPFPPERWRLTAELASQLRTPVAAGEDAASPALLLELAGVVPVLRIDATVSGGYAGALDAANAAHDRGASVMTHAFPDQHAHLAGSPAVGMVEMIPDASGVNPVGQLLARRQRIDCGELWLSDEPGHGAPLDWRAVERAARTTWQGTAEGREGLECN